VSPRTINNSGGNFAVASNANHLARSASQDRIEKVDFHFLVILNLFLFIIRVCV